MRRWTRNLWKYLTSTKATPSATNRRAMNRRARLQLEYLEDRTVLSTATATGTLTGLTFLDANTNGHLDSGELAMPGVKVVLNGTLTNPISNTVSAASWAAGVATITLSAPSVLQAGDTVTISGMTPAGFNGTFTVTKVPTASTFTFALATNPGAATAFGTAVETGVTATMTTNASGGYTFNNVLPGTYKVTAGPVTGLINSTTPTPSVSGIGLSGGQSLSNNLGFTGKLSPSAISMALFLTQTLTVGHAFGPLSTTPNNVNTRPDNAPAMSTAIANQTVNINAADTHIDLAGHFKDDDFTNSQVTFNITNGTTAEKIVLDLFDAKDPQTVANFFDYINSGSYNNSIFHRLVTPTASGGLDILQGGALSLTPNGTTQSVTLTNPVANTTKFTLTFNGATTTPITFTGTTATDTQSVKDALTALSTVGGKGGSVTVTEGTSGTFTIVFGDSLANAAQPKMTGTVTAGTATISTKIETALATVPILSPGSTGVPSEFGTSNTAGTIAMALSGQPSDPNSGTDQFFFNIGNNASSLDSQKFTVFGKIESISTTTLDTLAKTPTHDVSSAALTAQFPTAAMQSVPLTNYNGTSATFPGDTTPNNYMRINSVTVNKRDEFLTYSVVSNSNQALVTPTVTNEWLSLKYASGQSGTATIVVKATDRFGASVTQSFTVTVNGPTVTGVTLVGNDATNQNQTTVTAQPTATDSQNQQVTFAYQWMLNGSPISTATTPSAGTQTLVLSQIAGLKATDALSVKVTPTDTSAITGAPFTSQTVTVATVSPTFTFNLPTISGVTLAPPSPATTDTLTANVSASDPEGRSLTYTYVWTDTTTNTTLQTTSATASTSDTLDLSKKTVASGDDIKVTVTANDGALNSESSSATVTIA
jgi:cyclophilin family peptidyl-prolyl cis-trans isomerase